MTTLELLNTDEFKKKLESKMQIYLMRPAPPKGQYYKRTAYDELISKRLFSVKALRKEYVLIVEKQSTLSSSLRRAVQIIVQSALYEANRAIMQKEEQDKQEDKK